MPNENADHVSVDDSDSRVRLAGERTLLAYERTQIAWVRTALTLISLWPRRIRRILWRDFRDNGRSYFGPRSFIFARVGLSDASEPFRRGTRTPLVC